MSRPLKSQTSGKRPRRRSRSALTSAISQISPDPVTASPEDLAERLAPKVEMRDPRALKPHPKNARKHPKKQLRQVAKSIEQFEFNVPVVCNAEGLVLAGHARVRAAIMLGLAEIPTIEVSHLSEAEQRAYMVCGSLAASEKPSIQFPNSLPPHCGW